MQAVTPRNEVGTTEPGRRERQRLAREQRTQEAMEAASKRARRSQGVSLAQRVKETQEKLNRPIAQARPLLDNLSPRELELYLVAEMTGQNRKGILTDFAVPKALLAQYEQEVQGENASA